MSKKPMTRKQLSEEASRIIRAAKPFTERLHNRPPEEIATVAIDMLGRSNMERRELRRRYSLMRNREMAVHYISTRDVPNPEQLLMEQQYQEQAGHALAKLFEHFEADVAVKRLLIANLRYGIPFHSIQQNCCPKNATLQRSRFIQPKNVSST